MKVRLPNNGMGGDMQSMLRQAQKMQEDMQALRADLDAREYDVAAGGGAVKVRINGKHQIPSLEIDPDMSDPADPGTLPDVIVAAVNEAIRTVDETDAAEMSKLTGPMGMGMGGMPGLF